MYWQFWTSFWQEWADLETGSTEEPPPPCETETPAHDDKYRYLIQYGTQILCFFDAAKECTYLSPNFADSTGLRCDSCLGEKFYGIVHGDYRQPLKDLLAADATQSQAFRCKLQHADRKWYWYLFDIHPQPDGGFICIAQNIHKSMVTQNTLQKAKLEAELALRTRSEFLSNMNHELRTPLNAIIGFSQIIESEMFGKINNPQYIEYVKHIKESGHDLLLKIEDLLEIANIEAGRVTLACEEINVSDIMKHIVEAQARNAAAAKVTLDYTPAAGSFLVYADRLKLQHILGHLVANAIRFSHEGGCVTLGAVRTASGDVELYVRDDGTGMTDAKREAIAAALEEDNCWTANHNRVIGLGLALTREFVALHNGRVRIDSVAGKGTTVQVILPKECVRSTALVKIPYLQAVS